MSSIHPRSSRPNLRRRTLLLAAPALVMGARPDGASAAMEWEAFRDRFITLDGRVVDIGNGGISHTEGQGYGLLFAEYFDDAAAFDRILDWTSRTLRRPGDSLHAWRYRPGDRNPVADWNNATDGDLFIAWALARAARRWGAADHSRSAADIAHDVVRLLTVRIDGHLVLLPGTQGFERPASVVINPSYYVFPAFPLLATLAPSPAWDDVRQHGLSMIDQGRFGAWSLPPDWLQVGRATGALAPAPPWPPRCSYDAIRVPLHLAWAGLSEPVMGAFATFYAPRAGQPPPAWVDLKTQAEAPYPATPGLLAVARIANAVSNGWVGPIDFPRVADAPNYYAAALILLARIAWQERPDA